MSQRTRVFISYSHKDKAWLERLKVFLRPLERDGLIDRFDDTLIQAGDLWQERIAEAIRSARVIVLLVSADFLASDFISRAELPPLLAQAEQQGARILPVIVGACMWEGPTTLLSRYQAINSPAEPLESQKPAERNRIWTRLTEQILNALAATLPGPPAPAPAPAPADVPGRRHALLVLNDQYDDPAFDGLFRGAPEFDGLRSALGDAEFGRYQVTVVHNYSAREAGAAIRSFFLERAPEDVCLVYLCGLARLGQAITFLGRDTRANGDGLSVFDIQAAMRLSPARRQVLLLDCVYLHDPATVSEVNRSSCIAGFQGEGRFVLSASSTLPFGGNGDGSAAAAAAAESTLAATIAHGLKTGKADVDRDRKITVAELFRYAEAELGAIGRSSARWAFDQSNADVVLAEAALPGENEQPTPLAARDQVTQDIRHPVFDLTVPTYILDPHFYVLDWNAAFDEVVAKEIKLVRGQDHAKAFVQALTNCEDAFAHGQQAFGAARYPLVDTEPLIFRSSKYGEITFRKLAAQIAGEDGTVKGWSVSLNIVAADDAERLWNDLMSRIEEEVGWSRYAAVYDYLLLQFPEYLRLVQQVTGLVGSARRCIDLGAGTGNGALQLLRSDPLREVWAVEVNETMLRHFRSKLARPDLAPYQERLTILKDDLQRLDALPRAAFDAGIMTNVLYAVRDPESCLRQVNRILKSDGILALSTPHRGTDVDRLFEGLGAALEARGLLVEHREHFDAARARHEAMNDLIHRHTIDDVQRLLEQAGFAIDELRPDQYVGSVVVVRARRVRDPVAAAPVVVPSGLASRRLDTAGLSAAKREALRDVFISYSAEDKAVATAIQRHLEDDAIPCWIAPRDIPPGQEFPAAIVRAIDSSRLLVLVLSESANRSQYAAREVARAADQGIPIIPFRVQERVVPGDSLALYLSNVHWLDAFGDPTDVVHLARLSGTVKELLSTMAGAAVEAAEAEALGASA